MNDRICLGLIGDHPIRRAQSVDVTLRAIQAILNDDVRRFKEDV